MYITDCKEIVAVDKNCRKEICLNLVTCEISLLKDIQRKTVRRYGIEIFCDNKGFTGQTLQILKRNMWMKSVHKCIKVR